MLLLKKLAACLVMLSAGSISAQSQSSGTELVAFRVDDRHVIAVTGEVSQAPGTAEATVVAAYGFQHGPANAAVLDEIPAAIKAIKRWSVHIAHGARVTATTVGIVQGTAMCSNMAGVLMRVDDAGAAEFARQKEKYFVAGESPRADSAAARPRDPLPAIDDRQLQALLSDLLRRELPAVQLEAKAEIERLASGDVGYHRTWARNRMRLDTALRAGQARVRYDAQAFALDPGGTPYYFVRAEWRVAREAAFGATLWIKGGERLTIVDQDLTPATWLRMFEFQGKLTREQYGQVLNVLDVDGDGWREILFAHGGYEGMRITLKALTQTGFRSTAVAYNYGC